MKKILLSFVLCFVLVAAQGQDFKVINATSQAWAGGIPGVSGTKYAITIQIKKSNKLSPDTFWVAGKWYVLSISKDTVDYMHNTKMVSKGKYNMYSIYIDAPNMHPPVMPGAPEFKEPNASGRKYKGVAMITYQKNGKQKSLLIPSFKKLEPLNYP